MKNPKTKTTVWLDEGVHERAQFFGINVSYICRDAELKAVMTAERNRIRLEKNRINDSVKDGEGGIK